MSTIWGDFLAFMNGEHPDVENLIDVTDAHAQIENLLTFHS